MMLSELAHSAFLRALGWAVLNSLWQFALLWLVFALLIHAKKGLSSGTRHALALLLLTGGSAWFIAELCFRYVVYHQSPDMMVSAYFLPSTGYLTNFLAAGTFLESNLPYVSFVYLAVVAVLSIRFSIHFYHSRIIRTKGLTKPKASLRLHVDQRAQHLGIRQRVQVWLSAHINTPMVIGFFKPMILIPVACINQLSSQQLEAILLHELAHIKRNDYLVNLFVATAEILFFFNPFSKLFIQLIKQERESSCDDWVLQFQFDPHQYASALLRLEQSRSANLTAGLAATGNSNTLLLRRIQRILQVKKTENINGFRLLAYGTIIGLFQCILLLHPGKPAEKKAQYGTTGEAFRPGSGEAGKVMLGTAFREKAGSKKRLGPGTPADTASTDATDKYRLEFASENDPAALTVAFNNDEEHAFLQEVVPAVDVEERDYSVIEVEAPQPPPAATDRYEEFPFVPSSSYSYMDAADTNKPKTRLESYKERNVREAYLKAKQAVEKIDWQKLEKQLKNKADLAEVQKALQQSLQQLNMQQINDEVRQMLNKENTENLRASLKAEYENLKNYKIQQQQYQKIHDELKAREDMYKRDVERNGWEINKQLSKQKIIVHI